MKIAVSAHCLSGFTSGQPVRGMTLELIRNNPDIEFQLYYTRRPTPAVLSTFYDTINTQPNVDVRYFNMPHREYILRGMLGLDVVKFDKDVNLFLNPGQIEYIPNFKGPQVCLLADLSTIKGHTTGRYAGFYKYWTKYHLKKVLPRLSCIVAISEYTRQDIYNTFPRLTTPVELIYNGISPNWFETTNDEILQKTAKKISPQRPYFVWWGCISRRKNIERLISAYRKAKTISADLPEMLLIGRLEPYLSYLNSEINNGIHLIPFQDEAILRTLVANSEGLIFPSLYEGFGLPVIEAFSQGINVACANTSSLPEISNRHGILFDPYNIDSICEAFLQLYHAPQQDNILKKYAQQFTYARAASQFNNIIKKLTAF